MAPPPATRADAGWSLPWSTRGVRALALIASGAAAGCFLYGLPELDERGAPHALTGVKRLLRHLWRESFPPEQAERGR